MSNFAGIFSIVYVTIKTGEYASTLSRGLIEHKLAACINIIKNVKSIYKWDNSIVEDDEHLLMIKTRTDTVPALTQYVKEHHPYKVCEVISVPIQNGNEDYLKFIDKEVPPIDQRETNKS